MNRSIIHILLTLCIACIHIPLFAFQTPDKKLNSGDSLIYSVFLIGDVGAPDLIKQEPTLKLLQSQLAESDSNSTVIFLGDNIYPKGLPDSGYASRNLAEQFLIEQMKIVANYNGKTIFIPGNHDWARMGRKGWDWVRNQEQFVESYLNRGNIFLPDDGCPGPVEIPLNNELVLIVLDTQWFLHPWDKPGEDSDCEAKTADEILVQLDDMVRRNANKKILVTSHHPMYTYGSHGGVYTAKQHLFPFTDLIPSLYIPVPVLGSIYPLYRTIFGHPQDTPHPKYRLMRKALTTIFKKHPHLIHAAGHEHTLQYMIRDDSTHYIVSGAGCKQSHVAKGKKALFTDIGEGFSRLNFYKNGDVWVEFWKPMDEGGQGFLAYQDKMMHQPFIPDTLLTEKLHTISFKDSIVTVNASNQYKAGPVKEILLGKNYRSTWEQPVKVPVFDIATEKGGLKILQRGGGMQTKSLRLQDAAGKEYTLRSIEKYAEKAIPAALQYTFAADLVQDQISASHPYASIVVPPMADAAGVYHTNPKIVYIPDDPRLGNYQADFANTLALFEERPAGDASDNASLGESKKLVSTTKLLKKLQDDNDNRVDQLSVLRARLFDVILGDWDRHDDQWRWASFDQAHGRTVYQPIPRDRDQVFFVNEGLLPNLASRKWIMPKIQGFDAEVRDITTFMHNGRYFDRSFLTEPSLEEWIAMADSLKNQLTDQVIEAAVASWPEEIYRLSGKEIIEKAKARRDKLPQYARAYYLFLAKAVDITGSDKQEFFKVERLANGQTHITVSKINKKGELEQKIYERLFKPNETREVRLYGFGGEDVFEISGQASKGTKVRVIGGKDKDQITDVSRVSGLAKKTIIYDTKKGNQLTLGPESRNLTSSDPAVNSYDRRAFQYNYVGPLASLEYNLDDGIFLGGGVQLKTHGFRKEPFATQHRVTANYAVATSSYHFRYNGDFTDVIGNLDMEFDLDVKAPNYVNNFFGLGNNTRYSLPEEGITYYRVRFEQVLVKTLLKKNLGFFGNLYFGPTYQSVEVEENPGRFIADTNLNGLESASLFSRKHYAGVNIRYILDKRNNKIIPTEGVMLDIDANMNKGLTAISSNFGQISSALSLYWTFRLPARVTLATRFGGGVSMGDYEFFQAQVLSGNSNLRGFRKTRFAGGTSLFQNTELRIKLFSFRSYLFPAQVGILGFNDVGRVWLAGEKSTTWHHGYGGGLWIAPLNQVVISLMYGFSNEDRFNIEDSLPLIKAGFMF